MKINVYGTIWLKEKIERVLEESIPKLHHISSIEVYLITPSAECMKCMYVPCCDEENCKIKIQKLRNK